MRATSDGDTAAYQRVAAMVGDAAVFAAATIALGPLALLVGPAAAWYLHGRRINRDAAISGLLGLAAGVLSVGLLFVVLLAAGGVFGERSGETESLSGLMLLAVAGAVLFVVLLALAIDAVRDLSPARRLHVQLDIVRLIAASILVGGTAVVLTVQLSNPQSEVGDAGAFALLAAAVSAVTILVGAKLDDRRIRRRDAHAPVA
jgi:hypothetical protein